MKTTYQVYDVQDRNEWEAKFLWRGDFNSEAEAIEYIQHVLSKENCFLSIHKVYFN